MARPKPPRGPRLDLAGDLCVAFVNTAGARTNNRQQGVQSYEELLTWSQRVGLVSTAEALRLGQRATEEAELVQAVFAKAAKVRSALFRIFLAVAAEKEARAADLSVVNSELAAAMPKVRLVPGEEGFTYGWAGEEDALDRMLWPVLHSAAELLISLAGRPQVRQCATKGCLLFFVDRSPSGRRVWCERQTCGNRDKSLRSYHRVGKFSRFSPRRY